MQSPGPTEFNLDELTAYLAVHWSVLTLIAIILGKARWSTSTGTCSSVGAAVGPIQVGAYPPLRNGSCAGLRHGEVVAMLSDGLAKYSAVTRTAVSPTVGAQEKPAVLWSIGKDDAAAGDGRSAA
jgi:hypothetical protein